MEFYVVPRFIWATIIIRRRQAAILFSKLRKMGICCVVVDDGRAHTLTRSIVANLFETKCVCVSIKSAPKTIFAINVHNIPLFKSCSVHGLCIPTC